jgi:DUF4097 and DUF4098 domain-containing protein YvlB
MPTFETPAPILATIEIAVGNVRVTASDRTDTAVEVRPSDPSHEPDVTTAEQTRVELTADGLLIKSPKQRGLQVFSKPGSVDVTIGLPAGSRLRAETGAAMLRASGRLGACQAQSGVGEIDLEETGPAELTAGAGSISVGLIHGSAEIRTGSGRVRLTEIDGPAEVRNANGETTIGTVTGSLRATSSNGSIAVERAGGDVTAKTANGSLRLESVSRGVVSLQTSMGEIEVGIAAGTAALIDAQTKMGSVRNGLVTAGGPEPADEKAEVHARTAFGDISIRRA